VALTGREIVNDIAPAINIAAAVPQTRTTAFFACTFIFAFSIAEMSETTTARDRQPSRALYFSNLANQKQLSTDNRGSNF
jgi:hypothetical protein